MSKSLKLLACMFYVLFTTAACHPNAQTHDDGFNEERFSKNVTRVAVSSVPNKPYVMNEYAVRYGDNRFVRCLALEFKPSVGSAQQISLSCDWGRSTYEGK